MRLVIQRVIRAELWADEHPFSKIGKGLVAFVGISRQDTTGDADYVAQKLTGLRIFLNDMGKMNLSVLELKGEVLIVPNFTLYGNTSKGKRPSFDQAAKPEEALVLYEYFVGKVRESGLTVATGVFRAEMRILVENDGPVTLICDSPPLS